MIYDWSSQLHTQLKQLWNKAWKNSGLNGIRTHDLCDTGAVLYRLWVIRRVTLCNVKITLQQLTHDGRALPIKTKLNEDYRFTEKLQCLGVLSNQPKNSSLHFWKFSVTNGTSEWNFQKWGSPSDQRAFKSYGISGWMDSSSISNVFPSKPECFHTQYKRLLYNVSVSLNDCKLQCYLSQGI